MASTAFEDVIGRLPFPVSFRCRFILTQGDRRSGVESIIDAFESLARFLALVVISDYLIGSIQDPAADERLKKLFSARLSPGHWVEILRETLKIYSKSPEKAFMPELLDFYFSGSRLSSGGKRFEEWTNRRNDFRSHAKQLITEKVVKETWAEWWPQFRDLIEDMAFLADYEMIVPAFIQRGRITRARICSGPSEFFIFRDDYDLPLTVKGVEAEESLLLVDTRERTRQLLLYPFMVVRAPADFYLFEKGERQKGSLQRVTFASLGPKEAMVVRRDDSIGGILDDLESRLTRIGKVGVPLQDFTFEQAGPEKIQSPLFGEAERLSGRWAAAGYPYHMVEGISQSLAAQVRNPPEKAESLGDDLISFFMVAGMHHGGNWCHWVDANRLNGSAVDHLMRVLRVSYDRPRLRALYALQRLEKDEIEGIIEQKTAQLPSDIGEIISRYVVTGKVIEYLERVASAQDADLARKAKAVLKEIRQFCGEGGGEKEASGLPLI